MDFLRLSETEREKEREREKRTLRASQKEDRDAFTSLSLSLFLPKMCVCGKVSNKKFRLEEELPPEDIPQG